MTWQGVKPGATLLATATFTVSNWSGTSFVMTVTNVRNTMSTSPNINARLTAFGFGLTPDVPPIQFSNLGNGSVYKWAFTNFPAFKVDVCLASGGGCAGGGNGGLNQGQSSPETYSVLITGAFTNGVTITPIPAKFQTGLGSLETDGVVIDQPQVGASDLTIAKDHNPGIAIPGDTVTYIVTVSNVGSSPSSGTVTVTETPPPGLTIAALFGTGWTCTLATRTCTRSDALAPGASYPGITVTT
ncbi:MAG TPA: cistern family PEP-CTERM protein, partial [Propionibacteriaceae bacterium]|nr:cistern family PEP-CTERM protein [Propionibacteriaceae bacterium]